MKIINIEPDKISYHHTSYPAFLYESIKRIGLNFPVKVQQTNDSYEIVDGHKRMSVIIDLLNKNETTRFSTIPVIIINNARTSSGTPMNYH